ncbi:MAG TPA: pyruvate:ferredoxin (flavodoxin) oxidoreductase [Anaeromyxobacteraceae bacterium]|nr:pyruvate:ferredoxin (flavodoxin) oxidoreductase [Anaeromyxobacteraceae bacterium]
MSKRRMITVDGNEAVASVAHRTSEVIAIYPITPSSNMGEWADEWSAKGAPNVWGTVPLVQEMQSEAGAAAAVHGALQAGALTTTFTASQGLLLMIPSMYKIAGELTPFCMHVTARAVATHALSIFGDHSDVMACRQTGFAILASASVQEAHDFAAIAQRATLQCRIPLLHMFDGFRTSHEVAKIERLSDDDLRTMVPEDLVAAHRRRALTPDRPVIRGTAQNPDAFFQAREAVNGLYEAVPDAIQGAMDAFASLTGRRYRPYEWVGHPEAERAVVIMGSGAEVAHEAVEHLVAQGERVGVLKVRLFRPFAVDRFLGALPRTVRRLAVLDRTKEPGAVGEPLYQDVMTSLREREQGSPDALRVTVIGGRYGLSSKDFTPAMVKAALDELARPDPGRRFTVGIRDDVSLLSLAHDPAFDSEPADVVRAVFYGLGADGTVGANKNSIKIIGEDTPLFAQGYFVYDSKKSGSMTVSHLRFGPRPIRSSYLVQRASFVACHQLQFLQKADVLEAAAPGATFLLNAPYPPAEVWDRLPREVQEQIRALGLRLFVIDAQAVARDAGMGGRINTVMQTCFFAISGVLPREEAIAAIKRAIGKSYARKGSDVVERNWRAVDATLAHLHEVPVSGEITGAPRPPTVSPDAPEFVRRVTAPMLAGKGDQLPVSAFPVDGTWPSATARWEKRAIAQEVPVWRSAACLQCNKCSLVCPHAAIRPKRFAAAALAGAPASFASVALRGGAPDERYALQVAAEDCTGCALCVEACPEAKGGGKALALAPLARRREEERANLAFFLSLPDPDRAAQRLDVKGSQFLRPLFEYSGACAGCGETPYLKLVSQLFGDRALVANATGCSSIYGGNLPTTPYATDASGRGPAWSNSLFEDAAEFGFGMRLAVDKLAEQARELLRALAAPLGEALVEALLGADQSTEAGIAAQRERLKVLRLRLTAIESPEARRLAGVAEHLVRRSVWTVGGDGWAYDIGYGGLDHVIAQGRDVNVLVLDTEVYSNTGGQASKATPLGAVARFATNGKGTPKKDLALLAMSYGSAYVARVALGAKDAQAVAALREAEAFPGPSIVIAYSHCIAHGYDLVHGLAQQRAAVASGYWPLLRFDPRRAAAGESPLRLDSAPPALDLAAFTSRENRFRQAEQADPAAAARLAAEAQRAVRERWALYERLAQPPARG